MRRHNLLETNGVNEFELEDLRRAGEMLHAAFERKVRRDVSTQPTMTIGAKLAAEEMKLRLKNIPEV